MENRKVKSTSLQNVYELNCCDCNFSCNLQKENYEKISQHFNPIQRYHKLFNVNTGTSRPLSNFPFEGIVKTIVEHKKKSKLHKVYFLNNLKCKSCPFMCSGSDMFTMMMSHLCSCPLVEDFYNANFKCLICSATHNCSQDLLRHLDNKEANSCPNLHLFQAQIVPITCQKKLIYNMSKCVICYKKNYPYIGIRADTQFIMCNDCKDYIAKSYKKKSLIIASGDIVCALCSSECSKSIITLEVNPYMVVYIGENCLIKLLKPEKMTILWMIDQFLKYQTNLLLLLTIFFQNLCNDDYSNFNRLTNMLRTEKFLDLEFRQKKLFTFQFNIFKNIIMGLDTSNHSELRIEIENLLTNIFNNSHDKMSPLKQNDCLQKQKRKDINKPTRPNKKLKKSIDYASLIVIDESPSKEVKIVNQSDETGNENSPKIGSDISKSQNSNDSTKQVRLSPPPLTLKMKIVTVENK